VTAIADDRGALPSWLLLPLLAVSTWTALAPLALGDLSVRDAITCFTAPAAVVFGFALADWTVWRHRRRPWHDWTVILLLLPAIAAAVWLSVGGLVLDIGLDREQLLAFEVGPGVALVGLLATTVSYHGRHHPDEYRG
jgi:hypothetical protein